MRTRTMLAIVLVSLVSARAAHADSYTILPNGDVVFNVVLTTSGVFTCLRSIPCTGSGTRSITVGSGANTANLTFRGVDTALQVGHRVQHVQLGTIQALASPGFTWPTYTNPRVPVLQFDFTLTHDMPVPAIRTKTWGFGPGGASSIQLQRSNGGTYASFPTGANPPGYNYPSLVYSFTSFPFSIPANRVTNLQANVGAVPEPATLLLLGSGLAYGAYVRRRKRVGQA